MKRILRMAGFALIGTASMTPAYTQIAPATTAAQPPSAADRTLKALYDEYARWDAKESGYFEDARGENKPADYLPRVDEANQVRRAADLRRFLERLNAIPAAQLSPEERVNAS